MKRNESRMFRGVFTFALAFAFVSMFSACSDDKVAGGSSDDAGIIADLNVAGLAQKGPFVKGSAVTVQGVDCKTMELTGERFTGSVKSDKGDFGVDDVNLSATCALFEVTGYYFNEVTGKKSAGKVTLHALSDLSDRKHVNINMLTELEYKRVMNLVSEEKMSFADAKKQAEKEVLASFNVNGDYALSEDLNIFENGDGNAALLAVSVLVQVSGDSSKNVDVAERVDNFGTTIAENGALGDSAKTEMADWAATAESNGQMAMIRRNLENLGYAEEIASFENVVEDFATGVASSESSSSVALGAGTSSSSSSSEVKQSSSSSSVILSSSEESSNNTKDSYLNPNINYGEMTDPRDGQVYKTVKIGDQIWMAQNLNYTYLQSTENMKSTNFCYDNDPENCAKYGRLYTWAAAMESCPSDWHLPSEDEWNALFMAVGGEVTAGKILKSQTGWNNNGNGTDAFGFSALPAGERDDSEYFRFDGDYAYFWSATKYDSRNAYCVRLYHDLELAKLFNIENSFVFSIRCLKDYDSVASSSSSSAVSSSSVAIPISALCKTEVVDACKYGTLTDDRDGQTYKTVKIGEQWWMAENLNYYDSTDMNVKSKSWCYGADFNKDSSTCDVYGRLYSWAAAIDSVKLVSDPINPLDCGYEKECTLPSKVQGVCPSGWHLPDNDEWNVLLETVGGDSIAGNLLKAYGSGWGRVQGKGVAETDAVGFSALPAGRKRGLSSEFDAVGFSTFFWSASQDEESKNHTFAYHMELGYDQKNANLTTFNSAKDESYSVRCLKN